MKSNHKPAGYEITSLRKSGIWRNPVCTNRRRAVACWQGCSEGAGLQRTE